MNDYELTNAAKKAFGDGATIGFSPLTDDGDALRLAVKLELDVCQDGNIVDVHGALDGRDIYATEVGAPDAYAATRRAIVRAAAEIGRGTRQETTGELPEDNFYKTQAEAEEIGRAAAVIGKALP